MRVLVSTTAGHGHVLPVVPLARALLDAGHQVVWATGDEACGLLVAAGIDAEPAGMPAAELGPRRAALFASFADVPPAERAGHVYPAMFGELLAPRMLEDLLPLARDWRPDLLVHEQGELAAPLVAALLGVPSVAHGFGTAVPGPFVAAAGERLAPMWAEHGLPVPAYAGCFASPYLDIYPPSMQGQGAAHIPERLLLRPVSWTGPEPDRLPELVLAPDDRPLVYLTLGTVNRDATLLGELLAALAVLDVRVLATVGPGGDPEVLGPQPRNVAVERFVSQTAVLPHCDAVVSHAGSGTVLGALALGLPLVCVPQMADQFRNSEAVSRAGAGVVLRPGEAGAEAGADAVSAAVQAVLGANEYRHAAAELAAEIAAMPAPEDVVPALEALTG
jgi:UDP:flavonoid glycosyltransferase YjiC (YdhE family)